MAATFESDTFRPAVDPRLPRIPYLNRQTYRHNMEIIAHFDPGQLGGRKMQTMALAKQPAHLDNQLVEWPRGANVGAA
jgi:hypothetical protein